VVGNAAAASDQAYLSGDSSGGWAFVGTQTYSYLHAASGQPWEQANGFNYLVANAAGANNTAYLYGAAAGGSRFVVTPGLSYLTGPAAGGTGVFVNYAAGFQTVVGTGGASDVAVLYGVPGNTFIATLAYATLSGPGLTGQANGFGSVYGYSGGGGAAYLYGTMTAADTFLDRGSYAELYGSAFVEVATGFASVWANPNAHR
jgi:hypothetical protein